MAVAKYWFEQHGAIPAAMSHDELEFELPTPISKERAMEVAVASAQIWIRMRMEALAPWQMSCGSPLSGISGGIE